MECSDLVMDSYASLVLLVTSDVCFFFLIWFFYSVIQQIVIENLLTARLVTVTEDPVTSKLIRALASPCRAHFLIVLSLLL